MAIKRIIEQDDTSVEPIRDVLLVYMQVSGRVRVVSENAEYISPVSSTAENIRKCLRHKGRQDRGATIIDQAKLKQMVLPTDEATPKTQDDVFKFDIQPA